MNEVRETLRRSRLYALIMLALLVWSLSAPRESDTGNGHNSHRAHSGR